MKAAVNEWLATPEWERHHLKGWELLKMTGSIPTRKLESWRRDNEAHNRLVAKALEDALDDMHDEGMVPEEVRIAYLETPLEVVRLYQEQRTLKSKQAAIHATLLYLEHKEDRRRSALAIVTIQERIDVIWDRIQYWKRYQVMPSIQDRIEEIVHLLKNARKNLSRAKSEIAKSKTDARREKYEGMYNDWQDKINELIDERRKYERSRSIRIQKD